jgi:glucose 1-dehydrogenase
MAQTLLSNRRALVTGAGSGIGAAIALELAKAGADVADPKAVRELFARLDSEWGGIDILINNAGIDGQAARAWEIDTDAWRSVVEVNLFGAFYCAREALRRMVQARSGVVINISSVYENIPWSGYSAYTASKAGLSMLTKTLAQEAAPFGVRVLAVAPGAIKTDINSSVWNDRKGLLDLESKIPMGRMGSPEEIARMVAMLASDQASYVTGTTVFVDGGMLDYASFAHGG